MRDLARYFGMPARNHAFAELGHAVRTGAPAFDHFHGTDWWSYMADHPESAAIFDNAMSNLSRQVHALALGHCDLSGARLLIDVGGGHGHLAAALLARYPELRAVVFDLPHVVAGAGKGLADAHRGRVRRAVRGGRAATRRDQGAGVPHQRGRGRPGVRPVRALRWIAAGEPDKLWR
jgi:hypothetical protein